MKRFLTLALAALLVGPALAACGGGRAATLPTASGAVQQPSTHVRHMLSDRHTTDLIGGGAGFLLGLLLFDAPLFASDPTAQFNAGIIGVDAIAANGDSWQLLANATPQVVNLLSLQTTPLNLGSGSLPAGTYPSVQLLLDPATTSVTLNGQTYPVHFVTPAHPWWDPTATIESVTVPLSISGASGQSLTASLDFNVLQSANLVNGVVYLTPTVVAGTGHPQMNGTVVNAAGAPVGNATVIATDANGQVANVTATGGDGKFQLHGINPGGYTITVVNTYTTNSGNVIIAQGNDDGASPSTYVVVGPNDNLNVGSLTD